MGAAHLAADIAALFPATLDAEGKPEGWGFHPLTQFAILSTKSVSPSNEPNEIFEHYSIPAFDVNQRPIFELGASIKSNKFRVDPTSVLVSKLNPEILRIWLPFVETNNAVCSTEFMQFIPIDEGNRTFLYLLLSSEGIQTQIMQSVTGSTGSRQRAQPSQVAKLPILLPSQTILKTFNDLVRPILSKKEANSSEAVTLGKLRDLLLPKLLSGEIRIREAEHLVGELV